MLGKLKRLFNTQERVDLKTGEIVSPPRMYERGDPTPLAPPVGFKREPSLFELIQQKMLEHKVNQLQEELGAETPEEAEDFDVDEDGSTEPASPYEFERHEAELLAAYEKLRLHEARMEAKYGPGGVGGRPPTEGASAPVPGPAGAASSEVQPTPPQGEP